jgi:DNA-binding transcriptional MerR regulator
MFKISLFYAVLTILLYGGEVKPLYDKNEIMEVLQSLDWSADQSIFANHPQQDTPLLFRAHNQMESFATRRNYGGAEIIHATPCLNVACHMLRAGMHHHYDNMPPKYGLLSIYETTPDQRFYRDEHLEAIAANGLVDNGVTLHDIEEFNDKIHHETALTERNKQVGLYMWRIKGFSELEFASVPDNHQILAVLQTNQKVSTQNPVDKPTHTPRLTP